MRIGFDAKRAFNNYTGLGNYSRFIIEALQRYLPDWEYVAYTPKVGKKTWKGAANLSLRMPKKGILKGLWRSFFIGKQLEEDHIAIYHGLSNELPFGLKARGIKTVVTIHDLIFLRYPTMYPFWDRLIYRFKFKWACAMADKIVAVSEQTKRDIIHYYGTNPAKIAVIYQDCDQAFHQEIAPEIVLKTREAYELTKPYILCVSTFTERKNQLNLVKAFEKMAIRHIDLVLVGGKGAYQTQIEKYIATQGITGVRIINSVPFNDLPALYQGASLFVYPSVFEGFGIPIVEALHSGIPVVAATGSCLEEAGGDACLYADPYSIDEWVEKMKILLDEASIGLRNDLKVKGKRYVKKFESAEIALCFKELFFDIIQ